jgi:hypothetical protein
VRNNLIGSGVPRSSQEFAGVRRWLLSGGFGGVVEIGPASKGRVFFFGAVSRSNLGIIIS